MTKPITTEQIEQLIKLLEENGIDYYDLDGLLKNPGEFISLVKFTLAKDSNFELDLPKDSITLDQVKELGVVVVGPKDINRHCGTNLSLDDCPIGITLEVVEKYI